MDRKLLKDAEDLFSVVDKLMASNQLHSYCKNIHFFVKEANVYIDAEAPWSLKKTDPERMKVVLWVVLESVRRVAIMLQPVMPSAMKSLLDQLRVDESDRTFANLESSELQAMDISKPVAVFPRVETETSGSV